jgi:hypothetical protein
VDDDGEIAQMGVFERRTRVRASALFLREIHLGEKMALVNISVSVQYFFDRYKNVHE